MSPVTYQPTRAPKTFTRTDQVTLPITVRAERNLVREWNLKLVDITSVQRTEELAIVLGRRNFDPGVVYQRRCSMRSVTKMTEAGYTVEVWGKLDEEL